MARVCLRYPIQHILLIAVHQPKPVFCLLQCSILLQTLRISRPVVLETGIPLLDPGCPSTQALTLLCDYIYAIIQVVIVYCPFLCC